MLINLTNRTRYLSLLSRAIQPPRMPASALPVLVEKDAQYLSRFNQALTRQWLARQGGWSGGTRRTMTQYAKQLLPLVYNHRKRDELKAQRGAVLHAASPHDSWRTLWVVVDDNRTLVPWQCDAHDAEPGPPPPLDECQLIGCLPTPRLVDLFQQQRTLYMEDIADDYFETEYIRGPRVEVIHHTLDLADIDPANDPFDRLKQVAMPLVMQVLDDHNLDVRQLSSDNQRHDTAVRLLLAAYKHRLFDLPRVAALRTMDCYRLINATNWVERDKRPLFIHPNPDDPRLVRFYNGYKDLIRGRVSTAKPGKLVGKMMDGHDAERVKVVTNRVQMEILPSTFEIIDDPERIRDAYLKGPSSCASKPWSYYSQLEQCSADTLHPVMVYGSTEDNPSDTALAVCWKGDMPVARAVISRHSMQYPRIYFMDDCEVAQDEFQAWLDDQGYSLSDSALVGSVVRHVTFGGGHLLMPYIDMNNKPVNYCLERKACVVGGPGWVRKMSPLAKELLAKDGPDTIYSHQASYNVGAVPYSRLDDNPIRFNTCAITQQPIFGGDGVDVLMPDMTIRQCADGLGPEHVVSVPENVAINTARCVGYVHASLREQVAQAPLVSIDASITDLRLYGPIRWLGDPDRIAHLIPHDGQLCIRNELIQYNGQFYRPGEIVCWEDEDGTPRVAVGRQIEHNSNSATQEHVYRATRPETYNDAA